jgi:hypothetical protein
MTQILVTKPGTLTVADKKKLRAAGVVTVEAERPDDVRLIGTEGPPMAANDLAFAAVTALAKTNDGDFARNAKSRFVELCAKIMDDQREVGRQ